MNFLTRYKIQATMKKVIKKVVKKKVVEPEKCSACNGSGLWRPDYVNSPQCSVCLGHGIVK